MSANLQTLLKDALLNNTYDYTVVHDTLKSTWMNSYSYLYQSQKSYVNFDMYTYQSNDIDSRDVSKIGHLYVNKSLQACFDIDHDFIHVCNREEFKRSQFYMSSFTFNDMCNNPKIFHKIPVILIDGKAIWDYKINARSGKFTITLPFNKNFVIRTAQRTSVDETGKTVTSYESEYIDHTIQVFVVDNVLYKRLRLSKSELSISSDNTITVDTPLTDKDGIYFISLHFPNGHDEGYELGTIIMPCNKDGTKLTCKLNDEDFTRISNHSRHVYVSIIFVNHLRQHTLYTGNTYTTCQNNECNLFILQKEECVPYSMPIPVDNLFIIKERNGVLSYTTNTDVVELFYPNIYRIKDDDRQDGDKYHIYYFYKHVDALKYDTDHHDFYYKFLKIHFNNEMIEKIVDSIYHGRIKYVDDIEPDETNTVHLECPDSEEPSELDYIFVCGSAETTDVTYVINGDVVVPAIVNESFLNTFDRILHYDYYRYNYGDVDFVKRYLLEDGNSDKAPIEYKTETLKDWIHENPDILRNYVIDQNKLYNPVYHLWTKNIPNLNDRLRTNTNLEFGDENGVALTEECYVFSFHNDTNSISRPLLNLRVFVDGLLVMRAVHARHYFNDYIYIPTRLVTNDSYIEVEIFPSFEHAEILNFQSIHDTKEIQLIEPSDGIYPTIQDVYYIAPEGHLMDAIYPSYTKSTPSNGDDNIEVIPNDSAKITVNGITYTNTEIYNPELFKLTSCYDEGEYVIRTSDNEKPVKFTRLNKFKVTPKSNNVLNKDIVLCIGKVPHGIEIEVKEDSFPYISLTGLNFVYDTSYIRIFRNGRLVPKTKYALQSFNSFPYITFHDAIDAGDILYIDITPYRYKDVYCLDEITNDQYVIDLTGYIDKPFDIRYYDVYLNGRKLSLNNVISISPWKIALVNTKSKYHLHIFEKERDYEYFGTEFKSNTKYYTIDDLLSSDYVLEDEKKLLIDKIIEDTKDPNLTNVSNENTETEIDYEVVGKETIEMYTFYNSIVVPSKFINPDQLQLNKYYIEASYPTLDSMYYSKPTDFARNDYENERKSNYEGAYLLDPDNFMEGADITNNNFIVYPITHLNTVDDSMFETNDTE